AHAGRRRVVLVTRVHHDRPYAAIGSFRGRLRKLWRLNGAMNLTASTSRDPHGSEKLLQCGGRLLGPFLKQPVSGVLQDGDGHIRGDELRLLTQYVAEGPLAADHQERHRQLRLRASTCASSLRSR